jgi:hypothetical protein
MKARNLVFIISDEHQARALSCGGHPIVRTPNIDALAERGTRFEHDRRLVDEQRPVDLAHPTRAG